MQAQTNSFFFDSYFIQQFTAKDNLPGTSVAKMIQDEEGFLWLATHGGLVRYDGYEFDVFQIDTSLQAGSYKNFVYTLHQDSQGKIWVGTLNQGIFLFDPKTERFTQHFKHDPAQPNSLPYDWIVTIKEAQAGVIWVSTQDGLSHITKEGDHYQFQNYFSRNPSEANPNSKAENAHYVLSSNEVIPFQYSEDSSLWFYSRQGLNILENSQPPSFRSAFLEIDNDTLTHFSTMTEGQDGGIWVSGKRTDSRGNQQNILGKWQPGKQTFKAVQQELPRDANVDHLYEDSQGNLWIGTWGRGLFVLKKPLTTAEQLVYIPLTKNKRQSGNIWAFYPDSFGNLWVGTWRDYLYKIQLSSQIPTYFELPSSTADPVVPGFLALDAQGELWVSTAAGQLFNQSQSGQFTSTNIPLPNIASTNQKAPPIVASSENDIWIGSYQSLLQFSPETGQFTTFRLTRQDTQLADDWVNTMLMDGHLIWCGTAHGSIFCFDTRRKHAEAIHEEYTNLGIINDLEIAQQQFLLASTSKGIRKIALDDFSEQTIFTVNGGSLDLLETQKGELWVSSYLGGLQKLDLDKGIIASHSHFDDLNLNWTTSITEDASGAIWITRPQGFVRFDPENNSFHTLGTLNQLKLPQVPDVIGKTQGENGRFYFAGTEGIIRFNPDSLSTKIDAPKVVLKSILVNNRPLSQHENYQDHPTTTYLTALTLKHDEQNLAIEYVGLQFDAPGEVIYQYQMEGLHSKWIKVGAERIARFPNLSPGRYTFRVKASGSDNQWSQARMLKLSILSPWWQSWWAYSIYGALFVGGLFALYRFQLNRRLAIQEARRLRELDGLKTQLYTNITHEFRTPLTVIQGMTEQAKSYFESQSTAKFDQVIKIVQRNTQQLLRMINQMLDLSKLKVGALKLELINDDIVSYLQYIVESFHSLAESKNIQLTTYKEVSQLQMDFDPDKLLHVVSNLLANALKFTPREGKVIFHIKTEAESEMLVLNIQDNGIGIAAEQLPYVFDRFYQADTTTVRKAEGAGIGLALARDLVDLMGGEISVISVPGKGSTFTVRLPIQRAAAKTKASLPEVLSTIPGVAPSVLPVTSEHHSSVLIVEDNADVRQYLRACLENDYQLIFAENGQLGIEKAMQTIPDLIISDVMMPEVDGFELCRTLKHNERTSHIPIILLTARADEFSKLQGLEKGADAYLYKPFNKEELFVRLRKLLELRQRLQARYQQAKPFALPPERHYQQEDRFIKRVQVLLETHLSDEDFNVNMLAHKLGMSRSQVFKKIKALTGKSTTQYIRTYRLNRAIQLLETTSLSVSEIAYSVGFRDPAYFSRVFSEHFGDPPSETRK